MHHAVFGRLVSYGARYKEKQLMSYACMCNTRTAQGSEGFSLMKYTKEMNGLLRVHFLGTGLFSLIFGIDSQA